MSLNSRKVHSPHAGLGLRGYARLLLRLGLGASGARWRASANWLDAETSHALVDAKIDAWSLFVPSFCLALLVAGSSALALLLQAVRVIFFAKLGRLFWVFVVRNFLGRVVTARGGVLFWFNSLYFFGLGRIWMGIARWLIIRVRWSLLICLTWSSKLGARICQNLIVYWSELLLILLDYWIESVWLW